ncbi:MAG: PTS sugar transporter subunit IIA [Erysipelotrichaceae bacterium]|jgi:PTS system ascorbate-specific IIA component|nr:PTS sugar transporter subunit IIA [Erysipelotrichaceae bacterium]MBQ1775164.1 PTS sugar transporter subunit IIA [Erysipelotrichaceae bacterium]MBQ1811437.1 PTS sugar transporter subunit IIA [Erysipelotrichaceae bacterium]MBQ1911522.1 PTS sugar transporter subunit IIA [Erysipelotrichaceae bacterium]MBQ2078025.1 PTS sugar transporter subunit IIA [Erysipelotrichaceae bacterium]
MLLKDIVEANHYSFVDSFDSWQDSIYGAAQPMVADGTLDNQYLDKIIENVNTYGPYFIIMPDVAMPHSTLGGTGVYKTAIGFCKVKEPVVFDPNDETKNARLFFTLAAVDNEQHLQNMVQLSEMLVKEGIVEDLLAAETKEDLLDIDKKYSD